MWRAWVLAVIFGLGAGPVLGANADNGKRLFNQCISCHSVTANTAKKVGPHLGGLFGRKAGSVDDFAYSKAMRDAGVVWSEETLAKYLERPADFIKGGKMVYAGMRKEADRADLIAYLKEATK
jgi:cytochrome c